MHAQDEAAALPADNQPSDSGGRKRGPAAPNDDNGQPSSPARPLPSLIDLRLKRTRHALAQIDRADEVERARIWRSEYIQMLQYTLHGMHEIAWQEGLARHTVQDWIDEPHLDEVEFGGANTSALGVRGTAFYRGYAIHVTVDDENGWRYKVAAQSDAETVLFECQDGPFESLDEAYSAAVNAATHAINGIAD